MLATAVVPRVPRAPERPLSRRDTPLQLLTDGRAWPLFVAAVAGMLLTYVWRVQDLFPRLGVVRPAILSSMIALVLVWIGAGTGTWNRLRHPVVGWAVTLFSLCLLSVPLGVYPGFSARFIADDFSKTFLLMLLVVGAAGTLGQVDTLVRIQLAGATLYCVLILTTFSVGADGRLGGLVYYDANDLALLVVATFPLLIYVSRRGGIIPRLMLMGVLGIFILTVIRTGSRGGFLGLVAVFGLMVWRFSAIPRRQRVWAVVLVAGGLAFAGGSYWEKMATLLAPQDDYNWSGGNETGRLEVWKRGWGYMTQRPLLGVGANAFPMAEGMISPLAARQEFGEGLKWSAAHNSFVQVGAELGFPGLIVFLALLTAALRSTIRLGRRRTPEGAVPDEAALAQALTASLVGYLVCGFFLSQAYSAFLYSVLGLIVALDGLARRSTVAAPRNAPSLSSRPMLRGRGGLVVSTAEGGFAVTLSRA